MSDDHIQAIRTHVEKHAGKERATFSVAGITALLAALPAAKGDTALAALTDILRCDDEARQATMAGATLNGYGLTDMFDYAPNKASRSADLDQCLARARLVIASLSPPPAPGEVRTAFFAGFSAGEAAGKFGDDTDSEAWDRFALSTPTAPELGAVHRIEHDGFEGTAQGSYVTREGKHGVVLQQVGTKVVHVYGERWLKPAAASEEGGCG
ncbi:MULTISPECIES: hypothetical protein [unclassified Mesorhizobium]|uniref:hypothetical protein n=1 Tax=unclassified Mesorhizobium TaxID=325217 RepID=UPI00112E74BC|nr:MULTISPECIES: hypothetical protein [unclassified Mesorhizobium]TPJ57427.1 hypothetical protein FJ443_29715 [Mesorhizobium sp. B2-6-1]TPM19829.1 hypothetical protein FJ953_15640 [Mesorhizobium sp. B2-3-6]TPN35408.1 hypothetical protein FJ979_21345 [Mesorhizobium sp. B1-1-6]